MRATTHAWQEIRHRPGRFAATILAVAISVAFLTAVWVYAPTETHAAYQRQVMYTTQADIIIDSTLGGANDSGTKRDFGLETSRQWLLNDGRVTAVAEFAQFSVVISHGEQGRGVMLTTYVDDARLAWASITQGRAPQWLGEIAVAEETADELGLVIGDRVTTSVQFAEPLTIVGLTGDRGFSDPPAYVAHATLRSYESSMQLPVAGQVDPTLTEKTTPGSSGAGLGILLLVALDEPAQADDVVADLQARLDDDLIFHRQSHPKTAAQMARDVREHNPIDTRFRDAMLTAIAGVAMLVGAMMIANTFSILAVQRRRRTGLLRTVGAGRGQVLARFLAEALIVGTVGAALGVALGVGLAAAASTFVTHSADFGLWLAWDWLLAAGLSGIVVTLAAALWPIVSATRVAPLEALRPATSAGASRRVIATVAAAGVLMAAIGAALAVVAVTGDTSPGTVPPVGVGAALVVLGVVLAAIGYVPALVGLLGRLLGWHPIARLAVLNVQRHPGRSALTASALILAVTLMVGVHVTVASVRGSAFEQIDIDHPADVVVLSPDVMEMDSGFSRDTIGAIRGTPGVAAAEEVMMTQPAWVFTAGDGVAQVQIATLPPAVQRLLSRPVDVPDGELWLTPHERNRIRAELGEQARIHPWRFETGAVSFEFVVGEIDFAYRVGLVSAPTYATLDSPQRPAMIVASLDDPDDAAKVLGALEQATRPTDKDAIIVGAAREKLNLRTTLDQLTWVIIGLLTVAALVALVGVANTLSLSVAERTSETGLLRALGLQRNGLRIMIITEALLIGFVATAVGTLAGLGIGWIGARATCLALDYPTPTFTIDWPAIAVLATVITITAAVAAIIPARRAARVSPVEAMTDPEL